MEPYLHQRANSVINSATLSIKPDKETSDENLETQSLPLFPTAEKPDICMKILTRLVHFFITLISVKKR